MVEPWIHSRIFDCAEGECPNSWVAQGSTVIHWARKWCTSARHPNHWRCGTIAFHTTCTLVYFLSSHFLLTSLPFLLLLLTPFFLPISSSPDHTVYLPEAPWASADLWSTLQQGSAWSRYKYPGVPQRWRMKSFTLLYSSVFPMQARWELIKTSGELESSFSMSQHALSSRANARWRCYSLFRRF